MGDCLGKQDAMLANASLLNTQPEIYKFTKAKVIDVYDGDTVTIAAWHNGDLSQFKIRLFGIDCAEMKAPHGGKETAKEKKQRVDDSRAAKAFVSNLTLGKIINCEILNGKKIDRKKVMEDWKNYVKNWKNCKTLRDKSRYKEKWGRLLANIYVGDRNIAHMLIDKGLAKSYFGGTKH